MTNVQPAEVFAVASPRANLGEGPVWDARLQCLYWIDITAGTLFAFDPGTGENRPFPTGAEMTSCLFLTHEPGVLLLARESGFYRFDTASGALDLVADPIRNGSTHRFNDGKCDAFGRLWIGTMAKQGEAAGGLYCVDRNLVATQVVAPIMVPNGLAWAADNTALYHVDTVAQSIHVYAFSAEQVDLGQPQATINLNAFAGSPDGMAIDQNGRLWVAFWGGSSVRCIDPQSGRALTTIQLPCRYVTSCAFGGPQLQDLYITTAAYQFNSDDFRAEPLAGSLFRIRVEARGLLEHHVPLM